MPYIVQPGRWEHAFNERSEARALEKVLQHPHWAIERGFYSTTPLMIAGKKGWTRVFGVLIEQGCPVDATDNNDLTALSYVMKQGRMSSTVKMIDLLASSGADLIHLVAAPSGAMVPALSLVSVEGKDKEVAEALLRGGADMFSTRGEYGRSMCITLVATSPGQAALYDWMERGLINAGAVHQHLSVFVDGDPEGHCKMAMKSSKDIVEQHARAMLATLDHNFLGAQTAPVEAPVRPRSRI